MRRPTEEYLKNPDPEIGGFTIPLIGPPGVGKTKALIRIGKNHLEKDYIPLWRGTKQCQWAHFLADDTPVKLWNHETINSDSFQAYIQGSKKKSIPRKDIDLREKGVEIEEWSDPDELIKNIEHGKINVVNVPGLDGKKDYQKFFFRNMWVDITEAEISRDYGDFITNLWDEIGDIFPSQQQLRQPFYKIVRDMPPKLAQLRKNNANLICPAHGTQDMHYYIWKIKSNSIGYMSGAKVKNELSPMVKQQGVNSLDRGEIVMPGGDTEHFVNEKEMDALDWIPDSHTRKLRLEWSFDVPNLVDEEDGSSNLTRSKAAKQLYEESDMTMEEAGEVFGVTSGAVANA